MKKPLTLYSKSSLADWEKSSPKNQQPERRITMRRNGVSPGEYVIRNLMNYSMALSVLNTKETGIVKLVMN